MPIFATSLLSNRSSSGSSSGSGPGSRETMATAAAAVAPLVFHTAAAVIATVTSVTGPGAKDTQPLCQANCRRYSTRRRLPHGRWRRWRRWRWRRRRRWRRRQHTAADYSRQQELKRSCCFAGRILSRFEYNNYQYEIERIECWGVWQ